MTQDETLALFAKGKDAWNAWAHKMLLKKSQIEAAGKWKVRPYFDYEWGLNNWSGERERGENRETLAWLDAAKANFFAVNFGELEPGGDINFSHLVFPGETDFRHVQFTGDVTFEKAIFSRSSSFQAVCFTGYASSKEAQFTEISSFDGVEFARNVSFDFAQFCLDTSFEKAQFLGNASFQKAEFLRRTFFRNAVFRYFSWFMKAKFMDDISFEKAKFHGTTFFEAAKFSEIVKFGEVEFFDGADFAYTTYEGPYNSFENTRFGGSAHFHAIRVERAFDLEGARFGVVPDFIQAHFSEAPRLDNLTIAALGRSLGIGWVWKNLKCGRVRSIIQLITRGAPLLRAADVTAHYRALRRLAVQSLDHNNERTFLKGEIRARRFRHDRLGDAAFWLGLGFEVLSDVGGSIARPAYCGAISIILFALLYYYLAFPGTCGGGAIETFFKALYLSLKNAVLIVSWDGDAGINKVASCLMEAKEASFEMAFALGITQIFQKICSITLLFLFALAVRNRFKIK
jgi:hypothetical protein